MALDQGDVRDVARAIMPLAQRVKLAIRRAVLALVDDSAGMQRVQVQALAGDVRDGIDHPHEYGFSSHPLPGATTLAVTVGGSTADSVAIIVADRRYRVKEMAPGEVAIHDDQGQVVHLKRDGIEVTSPFNITATAGENITATAGLAATVTATGNLRLVGATIEIHALASLKMDCGGYGETWLPTGRRLWTQGTSTTQMGPPQPPEHPT